MYRNPGFDMSSHASVRAASDVSEARSADRQVPGITPPFMFSRLFSVTGILLAAMVVVTLILG